MKEIFKYIGLFFLIVFSFYYTDKISTMLIYKSDLMQEINNNKEKYEKDFVNAIIDQDNIIPGTNGIKINELDSYYRMKKNNAFSKTDLVYEEISPIISIENNKNLIISKGRESKQMVALLLNNNKEINIYALENRIKLTKLITYSEFDKNNYFEQLNIDEDYKKLDIILDKYKLNTNICLVNYLEKEKCHQDQKYLVKPTYIIKDVINLKNKLSAGDIILIDDTMNLINFKLLLREISYRNLKIDFLSNVISEKSIHQ